ncbi:ribulose-phosphate 3-epimerase [Candidatus Woesearchaeota archaeon]|nr:ribulose-phosphate 3-epimerase [Candidatus Woesearchaeota archaeon]
MNLNKISPSILDVKLEKDMIKLLERSFARLHIDVNDNTLTKESNQYPPSKVKNIKTSLIKDVHLMVKNPKKYILSYKNAGAEIINIHVEANDVEETLDLIKKANMKAGLVINPETKVKAIEPYLNKIKEVLIMSVHPGKGGQKFLKRQAKKIKQVRKLNHRLIIKIDGGINNKTIKYCINADYIIMGHYLFKEMNPMRAIAEINKEDTAHHLRESVLKMLVEAKSGHPAGSLGMADVFTELYTYMNYNPLKPNDPKRDYLVLSNGHICPILYASMAFFGYFNEKELLTLRKINSRLQGHPHRTALPGLETTSGPLGCGISQASGMALALRLDKKPNRVICLVSDGEQDEGNTWEGVMFAAKYNLTNLTCIMDYNGIQLSGFTKDIMPLSNLKKKYKDFGWDVKVINGHSFKQIRKALNYKNKRPLMIIAKTIPSKGVYFMENKWEWHGKAPTENAISVLNGS